MTSMNNSPCFLNGFDGRLDRHANLDKLFKGMHGGINRNGDPSTLDVKQQSEISSARTFADAIRRVELRHRYIVNRVHVVLAPAPLAAFGNSSTCDHYCTLNFYGVRNFLHRSAVNTIQFESNLPRLPAETRDGFKAGASFIQDGGHFSIANTGNPKITTQIDKANNTIAAIINLICHSQSLKYS